MYKSNFTYAGLYSGTITDAGMEHLKGLKQLQKLFLRETRITDAGLGQLVEMNQLKLLDIEYNLITDDGLKHLEGLKQLQELDLRGTEVTDVGVANMKNAIPNLQIIINHPTGYR